MPCDDKEKRRWINVENESTFHLSITGEDTSSVRMAVNGKETDYDPEQPLALESPDRYVWWITVRHAEEGPLQVKAEVRKPPEDPDHEGKRHGEPYCHQPEGDEGEVDFVTLEALTRLGG